MRVSSNRRVSAEFELGSGYLRRNRWGVLAIGGTRCVFDLLDGQAALSLNRIVRVITVQVR